MQWAYKQHNCSLGSTAVHAVLLKSSLCGYLLSCCLMKECVVWLLDVGSRAVEVVWRISHISDDKSWDNWVNSPAQCWEISIWCNSTSSQASRSTAAWMRTGDSTSKWVILYGINIF